ncbi:RDD family protein [Halolamina salifodinae]|uniref:Putative RDD family membrane protein YckC n=1 Tax=Halolamina salifodinae TaxID=1202767 RepID=A0A8T4GRP6_9EURY|nr:RDD family protein [Halolamina salifodinae]MBP1985707.1 putative RDD family membrane protein YckC [Halolamina salifodinae]
MSTRPSSGRGPGNVDVVGDRIVVQIVDYVLMFVLLVGFAVAGVAAAGANAGEGVVFLGVLVVGLGYGTVLEGVYGKTVGKMATNIRVVGRGGREIGFGQALIRNIPALFGGWLTWLVGIAVIAMDEQNQRLFDQAAATYVVKDGSSAPATTAKRSPEFTR